MRRLFQADRKKKQQLVKAQDVRRLGTLVNATLTRVAPTVMVEGGEELTVNGRNDSGDRAAVCQRTLLTVVAERMMGV